MAFRPYSQIDIAFSSVPWDRSYSDVPDFSDDSELLKYLESAIVYTFSFITADNARAKFNLEKDGITQPRDVIVPLSSIAGANISEPLEFIKEVNYVVARYTNQSGGYSYEYYFITDIIMVRPDVVKCSLEMDVFQTYRLNYHYAIKGGVVERKHCERMEIGYRIIPGKTDAEPEKLIIDTTADSPARIADDIENENYSLKPIKTEMPGYISESYDFEESALIPGGWLCAFYDISSLPRAYLEEAIDYGFYNGMAKLPYFMVAFPIFSKESKIERCRAIYIDTLGEEHDIRLATFLRKSANYYVDTEINFLATASDGFAYVSEGWGFKYNNNGVDAFIQAKCLGVSFMKTCPFQEKLKIRRDGTDSTLAVMWFDHSDRSSNNATFYFYNVDRTESRAAYYHCAVITSKLAEPVRTSNISFPFDSLFSISDQKKEQAFNMAMEPKIYSPAFAKMTIVNPQGGSYDYNLFDAFAYYSISRGLNSEFCAVDIPDVATPFQFIGVYPIYQAITIDEPVFKFKNTNAGLIYSATANVPTMTDQLEEYIRNDRNAYLTSVLSAGESLAKGVISSGLSKNPKGVISGAFAAVSEMVSHQLKVDSLLNAPVNITFSKVSPSFIYLPSNTSMADYIAYYSVSDADKAVIFDYFHRFGYPYNKTLDSENWFNRHYYDYIKLATPSIQMIGTDKGMVAVPTPAREKIAQALNRGVTFWHDMDYWQRYDIENWEKDIYEVLTK